MRYEYFEVRLKGSTDGVELGWYAGNKDKEAYFVSLIEAFNYLGSIGATLKIQNKAGIFIFERPLPDEVKLIKCSGCLNGFTRDKVIYVNDLPYCSHCLNDERMSNLPTGNEAEKIREFYRHLVKIKDSTKDDEPLRRVDRINTLVAMEAYFPYLADGVKVSENNNNTKKIGWATHVNEPFISVDSLVDEIKKYLDLATKGRESAINEKNDTQKSHYNSQIACYHRCLSIIEKYIGGHEDE